MSRRRQRERQQEGEDASRVMGPNSALTAFLREQGINANEIRRRHEQRMGRQQNEQNEQNEQIEEDDIEEQEEDEEVVEIRRAARRKRGRDSDDSGNEEGSEENDEFKNATAIRGGKAACPDCEIDFIINVYSIKNNDGMFLCKNCGLEVIKERRRQNRHRNTDAVKKQKKRIATSLLDNKEYRLSSLQDVCIKTISKFIDDIDQLGDIGQANLEKICRILSRNRRLNSETMKLFLYPNAKQVEFWDCSTIAPQSLGLIPAYAPHITHLNLTMCGQLSNHNLKLIGDKLTSLDSLILDGPFLVRKDAWIEFFEQVGDRLVRFEVGNTHRIDSEVLAMLVQTCGGKLERLRLHKLSALEDPAAIYMLAEMTQLTHLEVSYPGANEDVCEEVVTDGAAIEILNSIGAQLVELNFDGCSGLTSETMLTIGQTCTENLSTLSISMLEQVSPESVVLAMEQSNVTQLTTLNISRCLLLESMALEAVCEKNQSLVDVNINSLRLLTDASALLKLPNLTALECGFVPGISDAFVRQLAKTCRSLKIIKCYGQPKLTDQLEIAGLRIIGPQQTF